VKRLEGSTAHPPAPIRVELYTEETSDHHLMRWWSDERSEDSENAGIIKAGGIYGAGLDLEAEIETVSTQVCEVTRCVNYLCTVKRWASRAGTIGDTETVLRKGVQDPTGIIEEFEGLETGVGNGLGDFQLLQSVDVGAGGRSTWGWRRRPSCVMGGVAGVEGLSCRTAGYTFLLNGS